MRRAEQISRRLKLRHLNVFLSVVEKGSMTKAAKQLAISQPVVSKAINELEQMLGVRLLDRDRGLQKVEPTVYGDAFVKRSTAIFDDLRTSVSELEFLSDGTAGEIRIGCTETMSTALLPVIVARLAREYPGVSFDVTLADQATLLERELRGRRVDLVIGQRMEPADENDLDVTVLYHDRMHVVASMSSTWARRRKVGLADLVKERWCLPPPNHVVGSLVIEAFHKTGLRPPETTVTAPTAQFTSLLIAGGQFLGVLGAVFLRNNVAHLPLKALPVELSIPEWPVSIVALKNRTLSPVAKLFIDCAREVTRDSRGARFTDSLAGS